MDKNIRLAGKALNFIVAVLFIITGILTFSRGFGTIVLGTYVILLAIPVAIYEIQPLETIGNNLSFLKTSLGKAVFWLMFSLLAFTCHDINQKPFSYVTAVFGFVSTLVNLVFHFTGHDDYDDLGTSGV